jgi:type I restriction enzyme S subunit
MSFVRATIESFCDVGSGTTPSRTQSQRYYGGDIPWVKSGELRETIITKTEEMITPEALSETSLKLIPKGAVLVAMYGATVGRVGMLGTDATTNQAVCHLIPNSSRADARFVFHALRALLPEFLLKRVGGAQPNISQQIIRKSAVLLPPLEEQRRIATILDATDALRAKRRESVALLDTFIQSVFLDMFGDPTLNPRFPTLTVEQVVERIIDYRGKSPRKTSSGVPLITARIVKNMTVLQATEFIADEDYDKWMRRGTPRSGDVLITTEAPMGEVAPVPKYKAAFAQRLLILRPKSEVMTDDYLMWSLSMPFVRRQLANRSTGSTVTGIRQKELRKINLPIPPLTLQSKFQTVVQSVRLLKEVLEAQRLGLEDLFFSLQQRAFNGMI